MPVQEIINLPMDEFNERLSKYDLSETQLSLIRDIRRRGKNKVAAQNCRKRKLDQITCLEHEVEEVKKRKNRLNEDRANAHRERTLVKSKFSQLHKHIFQVNIIKIYFVKYFNKIDYLLFRIWEIPTATRTHRTTTVYSNPSTVQCICFPRSTRTAAIVRLAKIASKDHRSAIRTTIIRRNENWGSSSVTGENNKTKQKTLKQSVQQKLLCRRKSAQPLPNPFHTKYPVPRCNSELDIYAQSAWNIIYHNNDQNSFKITKQYEKWIENKNWKTLYFFCVRIYRQLCIVIYKYKKKHIKWTSIVDITMCFIHFPVTITPNTLCSDPACSFVCLFACAF